MNRILERPVSSFPPWSWGPAGATTYLFTTLAAAITADEAFPGLPAWAHSAITATIYIAPLAALSVIRRCRGKGRAA